MTCTGCENHINSALIAHVAVYEAISSYDDGSALVKYDKSKVEINELVALVETETGYTVLGFEIIENAE
jgi:copper chaperone CopZ